MATCPWLRGPRSWRRSGSENLVSNGIKWPVSIGKAMLFSVQAWFLMVFPHSGADRSIEPSWSRLFRDAVSAPGLPHLPGASQLILELRARVRRARLPLRRSSTVGPKSHSSRALEAWGKAYVTEVRVLHGEHGHGPLCPTPGG